MSEHGGGRRPAVFTGSSGAIREALVAALRAAGGSADVATLASLARRRRRREPG